MLDFKHSDMQYEDEYTWTRDKGDKPYNGKKDRDRLDRDEGYEVLDFANSYLFENIPFANLDDLHKLEEILKNVLPSNIVMKDEIVDFLDKNW